MKLVFIATSVHISELNTTGTITLMIKPRVWVEPKRRGLGATRAVSDQRASLIFSN